MIVVLLLLALLVAEPAMTVGKRISKRIRGISDDIEEDEDEISKL